MKVIGLTGGIGSGKSTVSEYLAEKGYRIIDADRISHQMTETGSPILEQIAQIFGSKLILEDGSLDRKALGNMVFSDPNQLRVLETMITDRVVEHIGIRIETFRKEGHERIVFLDAPLLFESGADQLTDAVWLVYADETIRISRVMKRDNLTEDQVIARMNRQMNTEEAIARADEIIDNSRGKEELYTQVKALLEKYAETKK